MKMIKEVFISPLEKTEGRSLFNVELKVRKFGTPKINDIVLC